MGTPRELFDGLYEQYFPRVYAYFSLCFGSDAAEDLAQATFLKLWGFLRQPGRKLPDHFRAWIFRVAVNVKNDYLRKKQRSPQQVEYEEAGTNSGNGAPDSGIPVRRNGIFQALRPGERELLLFKQAGLTSEELGKIYEISPSAVRSRLSAARTHFKSVLREYGVMCDED